MSIFDFFRPQRSNSAAAAKDRLQILMAHQRTNSSSPDYLPMLQKDLLAVILKYVDIDPEKVIVKLERDSDISMLEVNIELPSGASLPLKAKLAVSGG